LIPTATQPRRGRAGLARLLATAAALVLAAAAGCVRSSAPEAARLPHPSEAEAAAREVVAVESGAIAAPPVAREFRGAWVATVANIDWPSRTGLPVEQQKRELLAILDRAAELRLNAVVFQVRPAGDALYASPLEPWSEYLTGTMGRAPEPMYDPLAFAIEEAHRRGLELHAWFNPYRAGHPTARSAVAADHISRRRPDLVRRYGRYLWMDPGEPDVQDWTVQVVLDVVRRYDVDGVHLDDYFYPYRERDAGGREIPFPDDRSWAAYRATGGTLLRDDWRRDNVDRLIERLHREIRREKPWVRFGVSPFGIWRPGHPAQIRGFDPYAQIYADSRSWLVNGWLDYFAPQLYWPAAQREQSYPVLLEWWVSQNTHGRHIWPGNFSSRVIENGPRRWDAAEIVEQVRLTRAQQGSSGNIHFSMKSLMPGRGDLGQHLAAEAYSGPALVPASSWLSYAPPPRPAARVRADGADAARIELAPVEGGAAWLWVVQSLHGDEWRTQLVPGHVRAHRLEAAGATPLARVRVTAVNRIGVEGEPIELLLGDPSSPQ
jgi:uncharacterized lipoprotein YddW (UPF0748 family)